MQSMKVADFMNTHPLLLDAEMPVAQAVECLLDTRYPGAPVVDKNKKVVGFLSEQDCLAKMLESGFYREQAARVKEIMQQDVLVLKEYSSVIDVAQQMLQLKPKVYPVVDDEGKLLGCINRTDILRAIDLHLRDGYQQAG